MQNIPILNSYLLEILLISLSISTIRGKIIRSSIKEK